MILKQKIKLDTCQLYSKHKTFCNVSHHNNRKQLELEHTLSNVKSVLRDRTTVDGVIREIVDGRDGVQY